MSDIAPENTPPVPQEEIAPATDTPCKAQPIPPAEKAPSSCSSTDTGAATCSDGQPEQAADATPPAQADKASNDTPLAPVAPAQVVRGKIAAILGDEVIVDINGNQGVLPVSDFPRPPRVGAIADFIPEEQDEQGRTRLKREQASTGPIQHSDLIAQLQLDQQVIAKIVGHNKGGLELELLGGLRVFMPLAQIDVRKVEAEKLPEFVGQRMECVISKIDNGKKVFVSRRKLLESRYTEERTRILSELQVGSKLNTKVVDIKPFGVFVDLGAGLDGMIPLSELAHGFVKEPAESFPVGTEVEAKVIKIDTDKKGRTRVNLSIKATQDNPFNAVAERYNPGDEVTGKVTRTMAAGALVSFDDHVEGLIPKEELAWARPGRTEDIVKTGDEVTVKILSIDTDRQRVRLSLKQMKQDPWASLKEAKIGDKLKVKVTRLKDFGAYVRTEDGVEGLVPLNRIQKSGRPAEKPGQVFSEGQEVELPLLKIDRQRQMLTFSQMPLKKSELNPPKAQPANKRKKDLKGGGLQGFGGGLGLGDLDFNKLKK